MNDLSEERNGAFACAALLDAEGKHEEAREERQHAEWLDALRDIARRFERFNLNDLRAVFPPEAVARINAEWDAEWTWTRFLEAFGTPLLAQPIYLAAQHGRRGA